MNHILTVLALCLAFAAPAHLAFAGERLDGARAWDSDAGEILPADFDLTHAMSRELSSNDGSVFLLTVVPPEGKKVDPHFFDTFQILEEGPEAAPRRGATVSGPTVDVSGYTVFFEMVEKSTAAACSGFRIINYNYSLSNGGSYTLCPTSGATPEHAVATAFSKIGDVDAYVIAGGAVCSSSTNGPGWLDSAGCHNSGCTTTTQMCARFTHSSTSKSTSTLYDWSFQYYLVSL